MKRRNASLLDEIREHSIIMQPTKLAKVHVGVSRVLPTRTDNHDMVEHRCTSLFPLVNGKFMTDGKF